MKEKIILTNVLVFTKNNEELTRLTYLLVGKDRLGNNQNFKGYTEISTFIKGRQAFDNISIDMIGKPLEANFNSQVDYKNPLNTKNFLNSIVYNDVTINLL